MKYSHDRQITEREININFIHSEDGLTLLTFLTILWFLLVYFPDIKTIPLRIIFGSMERFQNVEWKDDVALRDDLRNYVLQNYRRREILDFMKRDYYQYAWSLGTLSRRLNYFEIKYVN